MPKFDTKTSKVKLWVATINSQKNGIWYNFLTENKYSNQEIMTRMTMRILNKKYKGVFDNAKFFDNISNTLIKSIDNGQKRTSDKASAKVKLWIGFPDEKSNETWYSFISENNLDVENIIILMINRILKDKHNNLFTKAIFYNNLSGMLIKTVEGSLTAK